MKTRSAHADLAIVYEHPSWFAPLFAALEARGIAYERLATAGGFDPAAGDVPARVIFNRLAMSSFLRASEHPIFYARALFAHWEALGATVINGSAVFAIDSSKARQLSVLASLGLAIPRTRVVHRIADLVGAAADLAFPLLVKANIGGSGAGIARFDSMDALRAAATDSQLPTSIDGVLLVQEYVPARDGRSIRIETLDQKFLYALAVEGDGAFDLCPADACQAEGGAVRMTAIDLAPWLRNASETIARAIGLGVGGVEVMIDDRDGVPRFYDINALSNFVARPQEVLGWDPHDRLVDYLVGILGRDGH